MATRREKYDAYIKWKSGDERIKVLAEELGMRKVTLKDFFKRVSSKDKPGFEEYLQKWLDFEVGTENSPDAIREVVLRLIHRDENDIKETTLLLNKLKMQAIVKIAKMIGVSKYGKKIKLIKRILKADGFYHFILEEKMCEEVKEEVKKEMKKPSISLSVEIDRLEIGEVILINRTKHVCIEKDDLNYKYKLVKLIPQKRQKKIKRKAALK